MLNKWCRSCNHEDANCPRQKGVNVLEIAEPRREVQAITRIQAKKLTYSDAGTEKEIFEEAIRYI